MKRILLGFLLFLGACGFSPLYQSTETGASSVPVEVAPIPKQYGFMMRQVLQGKFGAGSDTSYVLTLNAPTFTQWDQTIDDKNFTTIMGISGSVSYQLTEKATQKILLKNSTSLSSSYSVVKDPYATVVAQQKIEKELARQLAEQVSLHVLGTLAGVNH